MHNNNSKLSHTPRHHAFFTYSAWKSRNSINSSTTLDYSSPRFNPHVPHYTCCLTIYTTWCSLNYTRAWYQRKLLAGSVIATLHENAGMKTWKKVCMLCFAQIPTPNKHLFAVRRRFIPNLRSSLQLLCVRTQQLLYWCLSLLNMDAPNNSLRSVPSAVGQPPVKTEQCLDADHDELHGDHIPEGRGRRHEDEPENKVGEDKVAEDTGESRREVLGHAPTYALDDSQSVESVLRDHARAPTTFQQLQERGRCLLMFLRGSKTNDGTFTERLALVYSHSEERYGTVDAVPAEGRLARFRQPTGFSRQEYDEFSDGQGGDREYLMKQVRVSLLSMKLDGE